MSKRILMLLLVIACTASCADTGSASRPRPQITSCPEGLVLICETGRQQQPSKGGAEEEIPEYDRCRCEPQRILWTPGGRDLDHTFGYRGR